MTNQATDMAGPRHITTVPATDSMDKVEPAMLDRQGVISTGILLSIFSCLLYGSVSVAMTFINKYTLQLFPLSNCVVALQMLASGIIIQGLLATGTLDFPRFSWAKARQLSWVTILYTANTVFSLISLKTLNIPMYNVLKRLTPMMILVLKAFWKGKWPPSSITASVVVLVSGCVIAGAGDLGFDLYGYMMALLSCAMQAVYFLIVETQGEDCKVGSSEMLYYNSVCSLPMLLGIVLVSGEASAFPVAYLEGIEKVGTVTLCTTVLCCALAGMLLNYSQFLCTTTNSALTTTIVGVGKGIVSVLLGFFLLGGVVFNWLNVSGITLNTVGMLWYTYIKWNARASVTLDVAIRRQHTV